MKGIVREMGIRRDGLDEPIKPRREQSAADENDDEKNEQRTNGSRADLVCVIVCQWGD